MAGVLDLQFDLDSTHHREPELLRRHGNNDNGDGEDNRVATVSYKFAYSLDDYSSLSGGHYKVRSKAANKGDGRKVNSKVKGNSSGKKRQQQRKQRHGLGILLSHASEVPEEEDKDKPKRGSTKKKTSTEMAAMATAAAMSMATMAQKPQHSKSDEEEDAYHDGDACSSTSSFWIEAECETGPVEYKLKLVQVTESRFEHLVTQLRYRVNQGEGLGCVYYLGVEDNGFCRGLVGTELKQSICTLTSMLDAFTHSSLRPTDISPQLKCIGDYDGDSDSNGNDSIRNKEQRLTLSGAFYTLSVTVFPGKEGKYAKAEMALIPKQHTCSYTELRIAMCGAHNAGKSTLMSVLTHGEDRKPLLCNGQGQARSRVFTHKHEIETGRTSSIAHESLAYGRHGICLNYQTSSACWPLTPLEMSREAGKMIRLFDLSGHERYLKTTCYGLTCLVPDFVMLIVSAQEGVSDMTREHAALAAALGSPIFVVITKLDLNCDNNNVNADNQDGDGEEEEDDAREGAPPSVSKEVECCGGAGLDLAETKVYKQVREMLGEKTRVVHTKSIDQAREMSKRLGKQQQNNNKASTATATTASSSEIPSLVPVLGVSCVSGEGVDVLHAFLKKLRPREWRRKSTSTSTSNLDTNNTNHAVAMSNGTAPHQHNGGSSSSNSSGNGFQPGLLHFQVHKSFEVPRVGHVLFGTMLSGKVKVGYQLLLGPLEDGSFSPVRVKSIQRSQVPVNKLTAGQTGTLALDFNDEDEEEDHQHHHHQHSSVSDLMKGLPDTAAAATSNGNGGAQKDNEKGKALASSSDGRQQQNSSCDICCESSSVEATAGLGIKIPTRSRLHRSPSNDSSDNCASPNSPTILGSSPLHNRKGTVLVDTLLNPCSELSFRAVVKMVKGETEVTVAGSAMLVHCGSIRQAANIVSCRTFPTNFPTKGGPMEDLSHVGAEEEEEDPIDAQQALQSFGALSLSLGGVNQQEEMNLFCTSPLLMDFKFSHWGEWMKKGSKLVLRNLQTGRLGGVGFVY